MKNLREYQVVSISKSELLETQGGGTISDLIETINDGIRAYKRLREFFSGRPQANL